MTRKRAKILGATGVCLLAGVVLLTVNRPVDDEAVSAMLIGTWQATDLSNSTLHLRKEPVQRETVVIRQDGTLLYTVIASSSAVPKTDRWAWEVQKGRLLLQYRGDDGADAGLLTVKITASEDRLLLSRKGYPAKEFTRVDR